MGTTNRSHSYSQGWWETACAERLLGRREAPSTALERHDKQRCHHSSVIRNDRQAEGSVSDTLQLRLQRASAPSSRCFTIPSSISYCCIHTLGAHCDDDNAYVPRALHRHVPPRDAVL